MMKYSNLFLMLICCFGLNGQVNIDEISQLPEAVANNAVCEGFINGEAYLFSFAGIDSTKLYSGIHLRSYRHNIETGVTERIDDLPDNMGKIAAGASRIGDIIYIFGGYHVFANGSEVSSSKLHRYDIVNNTFLSDGAQIPVAIDDHVQAVWQDSLIYIITGWSNSTNVPNVQIYDPSSDSWQVGTSTPNTHTYKSFGASGTIINNTIYYFGGARSINSFGPQNQLRKGVIDADDPTKISWSISIPDPNTFGYRMACTSIENVIFWIGGSNNTYNYDGVAYDGSGGVPPANRVLYKKDSDLDFSQIILDEIPMDLRGIAEVTDTKMYLAGGMNANQEVSNKIYELEFDLSILSTNTENEISDNTELNPNPFYDDLMITSKQPQNIKVYNGLAQQVFEQDLIIGTTVLPLSFLSPGIYFIELNQGDYKIVKKLIKN